MASIEELKREEVKKWMLEHLNELDELLGEISAARENHLLKKRVEELEKERNSQAMSYGRRLARVEKERDELKSKLGMPVEPKKAKRKKGADPPPEGEPEHFAKPATLSERLAAERDRSEG
jgi:hypothetical protein